jgi:hypothetical protein
LAKTGQAHIVDLLLFDLLHLMGACAELNADELMIETSNRIDDVDDAA